MSVLVVQGDARHLPLPDRCVDLVVTSPPYFGLRSYTDGCPTCAETAKMLTRGYMERYCPGCGKVRKRNVCPDCNLTTLATDKTKAAQKSRNCPDCGGTGQVHYDGQIGSEATPAAYVDALVACTREWVRVLKPSGSLFINLGDKYAGSQQQSHGRQSAISSADYWQWSKAQGQPKSLMGLPWRYALACIDQLGLILRAEIVWAKPNGLPESVTDRVRRAHEQVFHFTVRPRYYSAVDEIREPHSEPQRRGVLTWDERRGRHDQAARYSDQNGHGGTAGMAQSPLGKLPGSVWSIPSQPLTVPPHLGVDHFAAFPMELPRRLILGWSPPGVCTGCGEGRRPVREATGRYIPASGHAVLGGDGLRYPAWTGGDARQPIRTTNGWSLPKAETVFTGYACACTKTSAADVFPPPGCTCDPPSHSGHYSYCPLVAAVIETPARGGDQGWAPPPTRPAVVLDPFGGTGTTALLADVNGRHGITVDRSADYCRIATWRTSDPGERARAMQVPKPEPVHADQASLFDIA